jgi:hypothetical protein
VNVVGESVGPGPASGGRIEPRIAIAELLAYLGIGVLLCAWIAFVGQAAGMPNREAVWSGGLSLAAGAMVGLGVVLARGDRRRRRGAGVAFLAVTLLAALAASFVVQLDFLRNTLQWEAPGVLIAGMAVAVAIGLRRLLPAVATQLGMLAALTALAAAVLAWFGWLIHPMYIGGGYTPNPVFPAPEPVGLVLAACCWWLLVALGLGLLARFEARRGDGDAGAIRRASVTRSWAAVVAVGGLASALAYSGSLGGGRYGRLLDPWVADLALVAVAAVLVERALRRGSLALLAAAAVAVVLALSDLDFSYVSDLTGGRPIAEAAIVLAMAFAGDRLRRRIVRARAARP